MRVLTLLACLAALLAPVFSRGALDSPVATVDELELVPSDELSVLEKSVAVDKNTETCLAGLGGLPKLLSVDVSRKPLTLSYFGWWGWHCCHHWCWCRCYYWWCPWHWFHRHGFHQQARQVLECSAKANNVLAEANMDVEALEKSLLEKVSQLDDATKNRLGLDEEPVKRE